jgi:hypothetical protein
LHRLGWREQQSESPEEKTRKLANTKELFCDGGNDNTRKRLVGEQVPKFRDGSWEENVSNPNILNDAMRGDGQDYEKSMGIRGYEPRGSVSHSGSRCQEGAGESKSLANTNQPQRQGNQCPIRVGTQYSNIGSASWWEVEPDVGRVVDGVAARVDRLKAIGNGQVSEVARRAWEVLSDKR